MTHHLPFQKQNGNVQNCRVLVPSYPRVKSYPRLENLPGAGVLPTSPQQLPVPKLLTPACGLPNPESLGHCGTFPAFTRHPAHSIFPGSYSLEVKRPNSPGGGGASVQGPCSPHPTRAPASPPSSSPQEVARPARGVSSESGHHRCLPVAFLMVPPPTPGCPLPFVYVPNRSVSSLGEGCLPDPSLRSLGDVPTAGPR